MKSIEYYCEYLKDNLEGPVEIVLSGYALDNGNVHPNTDDIEGIKILASLIKIRATQTVDLSLLNLTSDAYTTVTSCLAGSSSIKSLSVKGAFFRASYSGRGKT